MSADVATANILSEVSKDRNLIYKLLNIKGITKSRDEFDVSGDVQMTLYDYFNYWTTYRSNKLMRSLENADYLSVVNHFEIIKLNGEI